MVQVPPQTTARYMYVGEDGCRSAQQGQYRLHLMHIMMMPSVSLGERGDKANLHRIKTLTVTSQIQFTLKFPV